MIKETAKRFKNNETLRVTATAFDRELSGEKDYVTLDGDHAIWKNSWDAAGKQITWDMVHYDVQLIGGVALHQGKVAEMQTGEGKTLVATLPVYLNALAQNGVHVVTVNDYLAKRDSAWMAPIFQFHGMTIDCVDNHQPNSESEEMHTTVILPMVPTMSLVLIICVIIWRTNHKIWYKDHTIMQLLMR